MKKRLLHQLSGLLLVGILTIPFGNCKEEVIPGVTFRGHILGGKGRGEVVKILSLEDNVVSKWEVELSFTGEEKTNIVTYDELGISIDKEKVWLEAVSLGKNRNWWENIWDKWQIKRKGYEIPFYLKYNRTKAEKTVMKLAKHYEKMPQNAKFSISSKDKVTIIPEVYGQQVELDKCLNELADHILIKPEEKIVLYCEISKVRPRQTKEELLEYGIKGVIAEYSTYYNPQRLNRTKNICLAVNSIDFCLVKPGEIVSFNQKVGPRTEEQGYSEADIILNNELVAGVGGGVCQVSTTLYNAVLLAGLEVVERYNHSMPVSYVSPGLDATVVYDYRDFKFKNNTLNHLLIKVTAQKGVLTCKIFSRKKLADLTNLKSTIDKEIAPGTIYQEDWRLPAGKYILEREGRPGLVVKVERLTYNKEGKLLKTEFISRDIYPALDRILKTAPYSPSLSLYRNL